jgi:nucleotide-binding universal stress UspA family protein
MPVRRFLPIDLPASHADVTTHEREGPMTTQHEADDAALAPTTVLVPLDGSPLSELSVPLAHLLAARFRATVRTVTVGVDGNDVAADLVLDGEPAKALLDHLADSERTLVCMSSHGYGGVRRRLIGSVAEQLIRHAPIPVIVSGAQVVRADVGVPRTLLAGVAVSPRQSKLLRLLAAWAPLLGANVELAHIRLPSVAELYVTRTTGRLPPDRPDLEQLVAELRADGVSATKHLLPGTDPVAGLRTLADRLPSPVLLAVDSHRAGERARDDVAYELIRESRWPILATVGT